MTGITEMTLEEVLALDPHSVKEPLTPEDVLHLAKTVGAFWSYDYESADRGKLGYHAELKSKFHSDGFFVSRKLLEPTNILTLIASQMARMIVERLGVLPNCIAGVPDGATALAKAVAAERHVPFIEMRKVEGVISLVTPLGPNTSLVLVEDFCTRGTGFAQAVTAIHHAHPDSNIHPFDPVIINRGGQTEVTVASIGFFKVLPLVTWRVNDWPPDKCPLCKLGSKAIPPKASEENWREITTSQQ